MTKEAVKAILKEFYETTVRSARESQVRVAYEDAWAKIDKLEDNEPQPIETAPKWSAGLPTMPGWYWARQIRDKSGFSVRCIREYGAELSIDNHPISGWFGYEWTGPIPEPVDGDK